MVLRFLPMSGFVLCLAAPAVQAQSGADLALAAARNQLGILEYCQGQGHIDGAAVSRQAAMFARMPAATDPRVTDAAYGQGQRGTLSAMGLVQPLSEAAAQQGLDEAGLCRQIATMALRGS